MTSFWTKAARDAAKNQERCDVIQAQFRSEPKGRRSIRRDPPPLPAALVPTEDVLSLRLAEEIDYARRMLDALGNQLSSDPTIVARHTVSLQSVDVIGQLLGHVASVIRSSDREGAVDRIGMSDLKARLTRKSVV